MGLIFKPINELRIGLAFHTPTWYHMTQGYDGVVDYYYETYTTDRTNEGYTETEYAYFQWHGRTPWKLMAGIAGVIGKRAIVSLDYQYDAYSSMSIATPYSYSEWGGYDFETDEGLRSNIKQYFKGTSTIRAGLEYRVTPQFSLRAGYNYQNSGFTSAAASGVIEVLNAGTDASYEVNKNVQHITCGLGYKYQNWYIDAAYVYRQRESVFHAFTNYSGNVAPQSRLLEHNSQLVFSTGFKF